jgi:hypothetical protein
MGNSSQRPSRLSAAANDWEMGRGSQDIIKLCCKHGGSGYLKQTPEARIRSGECDCFHSEELSRELVMRDILPGHDPVMRGA